MEKLTNKNNNKKNKNEPKYEISDEKKAEIRQLAKKFNNHFKIVASDNITGYLDKNLNWQKF